MCECEEQRSESGQEDAEEKVLDVQEDVGKVILSGQEDVEETVLDVQDDGKRKYLRFAAAGILALVVIVVVVLMVKRDPVTLKKKVFVTEYKTAVNRELSTYIKNPEKHADAVLDLSKVDTNETGTYPATVTYNGKACKFSIKVEDTTPPEVVVSSTVTVMVGEALSSDTVIETMTDDAGIAGIAFENGSLSEGTVDAAGNVVPAACVFDATGDTTNKVAVTDNNGNRTEQTFSVHVTDNLLSNVEGIGDRTVAVNAENVNYMEGINWNELIKTVTCDSSKVNLTEPGRYPLTYTIIANDADAASGKAATLKVVKAVINVVADTPEEQVASAEASPPEESPPEESPAEENGGDEEWEE
ncbi:hypothetical protein [Hespellia stercorisuis]|uniref:Ig-like domain (Group 3) n=1 Tax=Hespellia stercorisuis DSM 15480 TaxID=1121950 RepID=A0A1M6S8C4_9FIRM|nr:hypothetical protein [Hespellia stercorisuis]SHK40955.1 hypothetical protein SAMN02745243_02879 [Hespellia stercorisuis DSM 15480]